MTEIKQGFPWQYEIFSGKPPRPYELVARTLARMDQVKGDDRVMEIGSGTGNSSVVLMETLPQLRQLICIDPSRGTFEGALELARHKFHQTEIALPKNPEHASALSYIVEMRERARPFFDKVVIIKGEAGDLNFPTGTFDRVFCSESFHWLAIENTVSKPNFDLLVKSVTEVARVLQPGGKLLFNSNGHLFRFGEEEMEGRKIDDMHFTKHSFRREFNKAFSEIAAKTGLDIPVTAEEPSPLHYMFDIERIKNVLAASGFRLMTTPEGEDYSFIRIPYMLEDIIKGAVASAKMGHFRKEDLADLSDRQKDRMIEQAKKAAIRETIDSVNDIYETFVFFVAQKQ